MSEKESFLEQFRKNNLKIHKSKAFNEEDDYKIIDDFCGISNDESNDKEAQKLTNSTFAHKT